VHDPGPSACLTSVALLQDIALSSTALELMATYNRRDLLQHPLVESLLQQKFRQFGMYSFVINLLFYLLFLFFLTFYVVDNRNTTTASGLSDTAQYVVVGFSSLRIFTEVLQVGFCMTCFCQCGEQEGNRHLCL